MPSFLLAAIGSIFHVCVLSTVHHPLPARSRKPKSHHYLAQQFSSYTHLPSAPVPVPRDPSFPCPNARPVHLILPCTTLPGGAGGGDYGRSDSSRAPGPGQAKLQAWREEEEI